MAHPVVKNRLPFAFELLFATDPDGRPIAVPLIRATFEVDAAASTLRLAKDQVPPKPAGERWSDDPAASYKYEPELAWVKRATDAVLVGHAHAPGGAATSVDVGFKVGALQKVVRVFGDRYWVKTGGQVYATKPQPFQRMPLTYERAFGGWDKSNKDEAKWKFDTRNPVGRGFGDPLRYVEEGRVLMPNVEEPNHLIRQYGDKPPPAGFGFMSPDWQPRAQYAGTYDEAWDKERKPLLPKDFDARFFNAASPGLIATSYLKGDEDVVIVNAAPTSPLRFKLPGVPAPACHLELRSGVKEVLRANLDTVIVNTDEMRVFLIWRSCTRVSTGPHDVVAVSVGAENGLSRTATA